MVAFKNKQREGICRVVICIVIHIPNAPIQGSQGDWQMVSNREDTSNERTPVMRGNERSSWSPRAAGLVGQQVGKEWSFCPSALQPPAQPPDGRNQGHLPVSGVLAPPPPSRIATKRHPPTFSCLSSRTPPSLRSLNIQLFQTLTSGHCAKTLYMLYLFNIHNPTYILKEAEAWRKR